MPCSADVRCAGPRPARCCRSERNQSDCRAAAHRDAPAGGLTEQEKYLFDLHGYIVVKNALSPEQLADCRARLAAHLDDSPEVQRFGSGRSGKQGPAAWTAPSLLEWGGTYLDLIDLPTLAPKLRSLFGDAVRSTPPLLHFSAIFVQPA